MENRFIKSVFILGVWVILVYCQNNRNAITLDFNRDVRPILNKNCLPCHGGVRKSAKYSMLFEHEAFAPGESGRQPIVKGAPEQSELIKRLTSADPDYRMPHDHDPLKPEEIHVLKAWIDQGAAWDKPWSMKPPSRPELPELGNYNHTVDKFIAEKLHSIQLELNPPAACHELIRRLALDLIGLPASPEQINTYCQNPSEAVYEQIVQELLSSPHFGEHWAAMWLDLARYADTKGYEADLHRDIWKYRDWVIDAFNADMPFDSFTIYQLAGDLLPNANDQAKIATAFHRNTMNNDEGGTDDEEFRNTAVIDRVNSTFEIWHGLTFSCIQCHAHPYDPFTHQDYYQIFAFFNQSKDADKPDERPVMLVGQKEDEAKIAALKNYILAKKPDVKKTKIYQDSLHALLKYTVPVMQERSPDSLRKTYVFHRGNFLDHGPEVSAGTPSTLHPWQDSWPKNRLGLAQWLVDKSDPLTARVYVNRIWGRLFGKALVETQEDFGSQGNTPSHPELLDYLAINFMDEQDWHLKALLQDIVRTKTYQQSAHVSREKLNKDPFNIYLSRSPRSRLSAEVIRDQALAVAGLLSAKMYGPSVMPYQPEGIWRPVYNDAKWVTSPGEDRYRRALYTYIKRTSPYPSMVTFDSPSREFCVSRRIPTNTPLQALVTLNDPVYLEVAKTLAGQIALRTSDPTEQIKQGFKLALGREITEAEIKPLQNLYHTASQQPNGELTPLFVVTNAILNLDEFITRS